ncbi:MAG TPA: stage II sporulation protein M [Syntrophomonadaceae bacterium]|nr:stage II sporulation protein M [Syntrophomonadaceae bacterium]
MGIKRLPKGLLLHTLPWLLILIIGVALGFIFFNQAYPWLHPLVQSTTALAEPPKMISTVSLPVYLLGLYFLKNSLVVLLCLLTARPSRGLFPVLVLIINGLVLGFAAVLFHKKIGMAYGIFSLAILPHGIFEFGAICVACALGMQATATSNKLRNLWLPLTMILLAAIIETFVSPLIIKHIW